jgi:hypothetical protein
MAEKAIKGFPLQSGLGFCQNFQQIGGRENVLQSHIQNLQIFLGIIGLEEILIKVLPSIFITGISC